MSHQTTPVRSDKRTEVDVLAQRIAREFKDGASVLTYRSLVELYEEKDIVRAFDRVKAIPDDKIKKSRAALFIYLVKRYAKPKDTGSRD